MFCKIVFNAFRYSVINISKLVSHLTDLSVAECLEQQEADDTRNKHGNINDNIELDFFLFLSSMTIINRKFSSMNVTVKYVF